MKTFKMTVAALVAAAVLVPVAGAADGEYVPFATDFPKAQAGSDAYKTGLVTRGPKYTGFASDFPRAQPGSDAYKITGAVTRSPASVATSSPRIVWGDFGIGLAVGLGLAGLLGAAALALTRRRPLAHG